MPACISTGDYIWRVVLSFIVFWAGLVFFRAARGGSIRFAGVSKPQTSKLFATAIAFVLWVVALLTLASTLFGWGC